METQIKTRKPRARKPVNAQIEALKKSVSVALKAAWHVELVKARREKAVRRERGTLAKKVEEQKKALKGIKQAVDALLVQLGEGVPEAPITPSGSAFDDSTPPVFSDGIAWDTAASVTV